MSVDTLRQKKLRISTSDAQVIVVQDGNAADASATRKIDDGFKNGYSNASVISGSAKRNIFALKTLSCSRDGKRFEFEVQDFLNRNTFNINPGAKVEFWAENGTAPTTVGSFPSWHSARQSGQVKQFVGFVKSFRRVERTGGISIFRAECVDSLQWANRIKLQASKPDGVEIPWVVFNVDLPDDPDWFISIKKYDGTASAPSDRYGYGNPKIEAEAKMTLGEILEYLQDAHRGDFYDRGLLASPGDDIFDAAEIAAFTIKPPKTVFERSGFADAVQQLIRANAPDFDIYVDPRTLKWHFIAATRDIVSGGGFATISSVWTPKKKWVVDDVTMFALSGAGSTVRIQSSTDPRASEIGTVYAIQPSPFNRIEIATSTNYAFGAGDVIVPMYAQTDRVPSITFDLEADCGDNDLAVDLDGVFTAVSIVSRHQTTTKKQITLTGSSDLEARLRKVYDSAYEANYRPAKHWTRRADAGIDGNGIVILERETVAHGDGTAHTRIYFSESTSLYGDDHDIQDNVRGESEWTGTAFHLLTYSAGTINCRTQNISAIVQKFARAGWTDAEQTIRRFRIDLDRDLSAQVPTMSAQITDGTTGDRFELTSSDVYAPVNYNKRLNVGRSWSVESTTINDHSRYLDNGGCPANVQFTAQNQSVIQTSAVPATKKSESPDWSGQAARFGPEVNGPQRILWLHPVDHSNDYANLCAQIPPPAYTPQSISIEYEHYSHQVLQVRVPETGFAGLAKLWYGHAEELQLVSDQFEDISQADQFQLIAQALHSRLSAPHFSGSLKLNAVSRWLRLSDMGFRAAFGPGKTGIVHGVVTEQSRFWGLVESIDYDFSNGTTSLSFNSNGIAEKVSQELFERQFVSETAEMKEIKERLRRTEQLANCLATRPAPKPEQVVNGCNVSHASQSVSRSITTIQPKQIVTGLGETALGAPAADSGRISGDPSSARGSFDFHPTWVIERNYVGDAFAVAVPSGAIYGGTENGKQFTPSFVTPAYPVGLPQHTADSLDEIAKAVLGIDLQTPDQAIGVETASGSTTTVIQLANALPDDGRFAGGFIEFRGGNVARPKYSIASHTSKTITLTGAMSEAAPIAGMAATVWPARLPVLNPSDFPAGGRMFKDRAGSWFVATGGQIIPATLAGTTLSKAASSTAPDLGVVTRKTLDATLIDYEYQIDLSANPTFDGGTGTLAATNPSQTAPTAYANNLSIYNWADNSKRGNQIVWRVPRDLAVDQPVSITLYYVLSGAPAAGAVVDLQIDGKPCSDNDSATGGTRATATSAKNLDTGGYSSGDIVEHNLGTWFAANTLRGGDLVHGVIFRDATAGDSTDTYNGTVQAVMAIITGKRRLGGSDGNGNKIGGEAGADTARLMLFGG